MNEAPEVPAAPPEIPRKALWTTLGLPSAITIIGTVILALVYQNSSNYGIEILNILPIALVAIIVCLVFFVRTFRVRYRGRTLVLTSIGFFLGQVIVCLSLCFGCCFAVLA